MYDCFFPQDHKRHINIIIYYIIIIIICNLFAKKLRQNFQTFLHKVVRNHHEGPVLSGFHLRLSLLHIIINSSCFLSHLADDTFQAGKQMYRLIDVICRTEAHHAWNIISYSFAYLVSWCKTEDDMTSKLSLLAFLPVCNLEIMLV